MDVDFHIFSYELIFLFVCKKFESLLYHTWNRIFIFHVTVYELFTALFFGVTKEKDRTMMNIIFMLIGFTSNYIILSMSIFCLLSKIHLKNAPQTVTRIWCQRVIKNFYMKYERHLFIRLKNIKPSSLCHQFHYLNKKKKNSLAAIKK